MINLKNITFLTKEQITLKSPSIFTSTSHPGLSERYTHIPTSVIVEDMEKLGWGVTDTKQVKARKGVGYQKHLVMFINHEILINGDNGDVVYPQILLTNSHDGKTSFTFTAGLFRVVCENGLVISNKEFESIKIRHMGYSFSDLQIQLHNMINKLPLVVKHMNNMIDTQLDLNQINDFAHRALNIRFGEDKVKRINMDFTQLTTPIREEDKGKDLWSILNITQEKLIKGDFNYTLEGKLRKARQIKNFQQDIKINSDLFDLALEFLP
jgi:hypothetical protein